MLHALSLSDAVFTMLLNVKMSTIVGILTFMSRLNFVLSSIEYEKSFITSGPGFQLFDTLMVFSENILKKSILKDISRRSTPC